jgi:carbamoyltransferase
MNILGISCYYHDAAACLLRDGEIIAAAHEERFTRTKHDSEFPINAIRYCLQEGKLEVGELDYVGFYDKPFVKFERILVQYLATFPRSFLSFMQAVPLWMRHKLWIPKLIREQLVYEGPILFAEHHMSHAASAFLVSPFEEAAILTIDGVGEWATATYGVGRGNSITLLKEIRFPHSLGLLYSAFTYYLGFKVNSAEYKVMGLAPYGEPRYVDQIHQLIHIHDDGSFQMDMRYFAYDWGLRMTGRRFHRLFGAPPRDPESRLEQFHKDIAASIQKVTEEIVLKMARHLHATTGLPNLVMAGGVALNCVANGRVIRETPFRELFVQPAAGDAGGALGVAAYICHTVLGHPRCTVMDHAYYGPAFDSETCEKFLQRVGAKYARLSEPELIQRTARLLADAHVVGWFQGRMEWGPRALGSRSILGDPRDPKMRDTLNLKIKFRESFRPFAPAVPEELVSEWFEIDRPTPFMLLVAQVRPERRVIPAVTHADNSARIQSVSQRQNPMFHALLHEFGKLTGVPVLINTSFNVRGEPIVCTPEDAYNCFRNTDMDYLVLDRFLLDKRDFPKRSGPGGPLALD